MAKTNKTRTGRGRADKSRRRAARVGKRQGHRPQHGSLTPGGLDLTGWHVMDPRGHLGDAMFAGPDEALLDTGGCPVAGACAGCGTRAGLHAVTSAFSTPSGFDVACATLCHSCDNGQSFVHRLGPAGLEEGFARHAAHQR
jgi:hypothetical protein